LRLVIDNERDDADSEPGGGYMSGRNSWRGTPEISSTVRTRSAGIRPDRRHFWTAWYRTPHLVAKGKRPPPPEIARSTALMTRNLQLPVALRQQPRVVALFPTMQPMVASSQTERERFAKALNERIAKDHPDKWGRAVWLHDTLRDFWKRTGKKGKLVSAATCGYWVAGTKLPKAEHVTMLCSALGMTRDELFGGHGDAGDPRLALIIERWDELPEEMKNGLYAFFNPARRTGSE
jgi:hypothetical protein